MQEADVHEESHDAHDVHAARGAHGTPHESPGVMVLPLLLICIPAIAAGWLNIPGVYAPFGEAIHFGDAHHAEGLNWGLATAGTLAGLLGIGLATIMYWRPILDPNAIARAARPAFNLLYNKYYFDDAYQWLIDRIILGMAGLAATLDRKVINDNVADRPAHITIAAGDKIRYLETGRVYHYAFAFVVGIVLVGAAIYAFPNVQFNLW
jgi:NADH-quinone oxidoreductase subunit L